MTRSLWTAEELNNLFNAEIPSSSLVTGISIDSRTTRKGDLFIALDGDNHKGDRFVEDALKAGASIALCHSTSSFNLSHKENIIWVPDTFKALYRLGKKARERSSAKITAITGSFGKTTTKEMLGYCLAHQAETAFSQKSFNNHWGVPVSLANMSSTAQYGVFEIGMNHAGEISPLTKLVRPNIALITDVGLVHKEYFKDLDEIVQAKCEIFEGLSENGTVILNRDSLTYEKQRVLAEKRGVHHFMIFGSHPEADLHLTQITLKDDISCCTFSYKGQKYNFNLGYVGTHWVMNALGVLASVIVLGANLEKALKDIENFRPTLPGRGAKIPIKHPQGGAFTIIDESYNSNPIALEKALNVLSTLGQARQKKGRLIAVIGDMYELGQTSRQDHHSFAKICEDLKIDYVFTSGNESLALFEALPPLMRGEHSATVTPIAETISNFVQPGDIILVKGSRGGGKNPRLQEVIEYLKNIEVKEAL